MLAPVVVFVYARPEHTRLTIEALAKNDLASDTEVYIFSDAAKNDAVVEKVEQVRMYIDSLPERNLFKSVHIRKAQMNKGLGESVIYGVSEIIEKYGKVIVVEDDLVSTADFLRYMNDGLSYYETSYQIWSISGYTFDIDIPREYDSDIYLSYRGCSWGWATWKDRWEKVDWEVSDYQKFKHSSIMRKKFNRGGRDLSSMLHDQMEGRIDSWAIRWCYTQSKLDMLTVYPVVTRIQNIGLDGTGTHSRIDSKYNVTLRSDIRGFTFDNPKINAQITKAFQDHFGTRYELFVIHTKRMIKKRLGR